MEVLADAAAHGAGIVVLPAFVAQAAVLAGRLRRILPGWRVAPQSLQLAYDSRRNQPMSVRKLIEHLVDALRAKQDVDSALVRRPANDRSSSGPIPRAEKAAGRHARRTQEPNELAAA
jgi:hypothetical protein